MEFQVLQLNAGPRRVPLYPRCEPSGNRPGTHRGPNPCHGPRHRHRQGKKEEYQHESEDSHYNQEQYNTGGRLIFFLALIPEILLLASLALAHRMPGGHDGLQYFTLQYIFLNGTAVSGEIPLWMPFMSHGTVSTWWYAVQAAPMQQIFTLMGPLLRSVDFLPLFYAGLLGDMLLLLTGCWLLSERFFSFRWTRLFVCLTAAGSAVWVTQPWYNFHFYYGVPLVLYFLHRFLETSKWRHLFFAGNLLALQTLGNLPYFLPFTSLVCFLYLVFYGLCNLEKARRCLRSLRW